MATENKITIDDMLGLQRDIRAYFSTHTHSGYKQPFELNTLEAEAWTPQGSLWVVPKYMDEEDIDDIDETFNRGLLEVGKKYGIRLYLPPWAYEK